MRRSQKSAAEDCARLDVEKVRSEERSDPGAKARRRRSEGKAIRMRIEVTSAFQAKIGMQKHMLVISTGSHAS
jgi:hypothetical protein